MIKSNNVFQMSLLVTFSIMFMMATNSTQSFAQPSNMTNSTQSFNYTKNLFVFSKPQGYGIYQERNSNVFKPGEDIILYIEPSGFTYKSLRDDQGKLLYSMDFAPTATIYDKNGNVLAGPLEIPNIDIISHYKNKEIIIPFTLSQTSPFPPGDYIIKYAITDINSGKSFDIVKDVKISNGSITS